MKLLRTFPKVSFEFGLASWQWLGIREQTPRFATCFGDIFLESLDGWWFLDTVEGTLELRWTSAVTMYAELESAEGRATYLMDDLVREARSRGIHLGEEDAYTFNPHPALGGELSANNLGTMRFELAVNWVGQMHDQVLHGSGELTLPSMPDDGRRAPARQATGSWDTAWSDDETFDVPFEQYLATTTFAAVAAPRRNDGGHLLLPGSEPEYFSHATQDYGAQNYGAQNYGAENYGSQSYEVPSDPVQPAPRPTWPGPEQSVQPPPADEYGDPYAQQDWLPDSTAPGVHEQDSQQQTGPTWGSPAWDSPSWGGPPSAGRTDSGPQRGSRTDDPFTAWDDLWKKR